MKLSHDLVITSKNLDKDYVHTSGVNSKQNGAAVYSNGENSWCRKERFLLDMYQS